MGDRQEIIILLEGVEFNLERCQRVILALNDKVEIGVATAEERLDQLPKALEKAKELYREKTKLKGELRCLK